jgi:hypothetical protein
MCRIARTQPADAFAQMYNKQPPNSTPYPSVAAPSPGAATCWRKNRRGCAGIAAARPPAPAPPHEPHTRGTTRRVSDKPPRAAAFPRQCTRPRWPLREQSARQPRSRTRRSAPAPPGMTRSSTQARSFSKASLTNGIMKSRVVSCTAFTSLRTHASRQRPARRAAGGPGQHRSSSTAFFSDRDVIVRICAASALHTPADSRHSAVSHTVDTTVTAATWRQLRPAPLAPLPTGARACRRQ